MINIERSENILLIASKFFGYYEMIAEEARAQGYQVDYILDRPSNSNLSKAIGRVNINLIRLSTEKYFRNTVLPQIRGKSYDYVLAVYAVGFALTPEMLSKVRRMNPSARFILYQWDADKNLRFPERIHECFDTVFSFERQDCLQDRERRFLPLFYGHEYAASDDADPVLYDCAYIGTAHPKKIAEINRMAEALKDVMPQQFIYHYLPSRLKYIYHKLLNREYRNIRLKDLHMQRLSHEETSKICRSSRCVLDAPASGQSGMTMRSIECCVGLRRKLITTNEDAVNYDFYRPENILIFRGSIDPDDPFFASPYIELPQDIYEKYSIRNWLATILNG